MAKNKHVKNIVANSISRLTIPYLEKYGDRIIGVYLCPYSIGGTQRIEIVVVHDGNKEIPILKNSVLVNELRIYVNTNNRTGYKGKVDSDEKMKLAKELKSSSIIYDPKSILANRMRMLENRQDISAFYNSFEMPNEVVKGAKSNVYALKKGRK